MFRVFVKRFWHSVRDTVTPAMYCFPLQAVKPLNPEISVNNIEKLNALYLQITNLYCLLSVKSPDAIISEYFRH